MRSRDPPAELHSNQLSAAYLQLSLLSVCCGWGRDCFRFAVDGAIHTSSLLGGKDENLSEKVCTGTPGSKFASAVNSNEALASHHSPPAPLVEKVGEDTTRCHKEGTHDVDIVARTLRGRPTAQHTLGSQQWRGEKGRSLRLGSGSAFWKFTSRQIKKRL
jgi:hypothetical protein